MSILKYVFRRFLTLIPVLFGVLLLSFMMSRAMPGDPILAHIPQDYTWEQYLAMRHRLGFDRPLWQQFFIYIGNLFSGNWGYSVSINRGQEVWDLIWERFPRTLDITIFAMIIAAFVGVKTGIISATHRKRYSSKRFCSCGSVDSHLLVWLNSTIDISLQTGFISSYWVQKNELY